MSKKEVFSLLLQADNGLLGFGVLGLQFFFPTILVSAVAVSSST
jgi:hypothetical protein